MKSKMSSRLIVLIIVLAFFSLIEAQTTPSRKLMGSTRAVLTLNSFVRGGDGGHQSECDGMFHSDETRIVALSSRWYNHGERCQKHIVIHGNGNSVRAKVVDECDSNRGCRDNIVDGSEAVWEALGVPRSDWGLLDVIWSDA